MTLIFKIILFFIITYTLFNPYNLYRVFDINYFYLSVIALTITCIVVFRYDKTLAILLLLLMLSFIIRYDTDIKMPLF